MENNIFINNIELLQAINDWQIDSSIKRGKKLKKLCSNLPLKYRESAKVCYRKIDLKKDSIWNLVADNSLDEKISSWTTDCKFAKRFKGGVPPKDGVFFGYVLAIKPQHDQIILNLEELYKSEEFLEALELNKGKIKNFDRGCDKYRGLQSEVILELASVSSEHIYSLGGYSSIIPGPMWTTYEGTQRILDRLYSGKYKN